MTTFSPKLLFRIILQRKALLLFILLATTAVPASTTAGSREPEAGSHPPSSSQDPAASIQHPETLTAYPLPLTGTPYTIQISSYASRPDADRYFTVLERSLPAELLADLRIAYLAPYFTIRLGRFSDKQAAAAALASIEDIVPDALLIKPAKTEEMVRDRRQKTEDRGQKTAAGSREPAAGADHPAAGSQQPEPLTAYPLPLTGTPYTIQISSYTARADADHYYAILENSLPLELLADLRIAYLAPYFTIRLGKFSDKQAAAAVLAAIEDIVPDALLIKPAKTEEVVRSGDRGQETGDRKQETTAGSQQTETLTAEEKPATIPAAEETTPAAALPPEEAAVMESNLAPATLDQAEEAATAPKKSAPETAVLTTTAPPPAKAEIETTPKPPAPKPVRLKAAAPLSPGSCITADCHAGIRQFKTVHSPVREEDCLACHQRQTAEHPAPAGKSFALIARDAALCLQCHEAYGQKAVIHAPVEEGECLACHRPHGSSGPFLLDVNEDQRNLCLTCHDGADFEQEFGHGPVDLGACTVCHLPHESDHQALLRAEPQKTCLGCHVDFAQGMAEAPFVHQPLKDQDCTSCHQPHGSSAANLLNQKDEELCFGCHEELGNKSKKARVKHKALYKNDRCGNCHLTHFSKHEHLLLKNEKDLCLDCHGREDYRRATKTALRNIEKELAGKKYLHGPVAEGHCSVCHDPHGSRYAELLKGPYPGTFYAPYNPESYEFCFSCHDEKMLLSFRDDSEHTDFRNGRDNLHFLHVARQVKGRTCQSCHDAHASDGAKLISRQGAPFGAWQVPIRFSLTESGGSCSPGCHRRMDYDRQTPVDNNQPLE